ncbi:response regulator transcription factor [Paenibacillus sp. 2TAB19]|uniref:response regulator transcription factor n=1 Tax=Paenibacillus sp. 2TAB19 TaxID=3233003 RepID=UPI003F991E9A
MRPDKSVILIVSSEKQTQKQLKSLYQNEGYLTDITPDVRQTLLKTHHNHYKLIVIDRLTSSYTNIQLCITLRKKVKTPILLFTDLGSESQRLAAFEAGADDCMEKPLFYEELLCRSKAIIKRSSKQDELLKNRNANIPLHLKRLLIDPTAHRILVEGCEVYLALKEFDLLYYMVLHEGVVHSRSQLLEAVWRQTKANDYRTIDTHIKRLREKLVHVSPEVGNMIKTVWGVGYLFRDDNSELDLALV